MTDSFHDGSELFTSHDTNLGIGPHPQETGAVSSAAHAVVAGTVASTYDDGELGDVGASNSSHKLGTVLGDTVALRGGTDHETGDVLEEDEGDTALSAELDEVSALDGGRGEENTVVGDDADLVTVDFGKAGDEGGTEIALELGEL